MTKQSATRRPEPATGTHELTDSSRFRAAAPRRITHLRVRGTGRHIELPAVAAYTVGREAAKNDPASPRADVLLPSPKKGMSLVHAELEWRKDLLWCQDAGSTNGTHANHEAKHDWFTVTSGMRLDLGETSLIAMDWQLTELVEPLSWCLGLDAHAEIDRALGLAQKDGPLLLLGPRDSDQEWLARRIHEVSSRREQPFLAFTSKLERGAEAALDQAGFGTVFVDLAKVGKVTAAFARRLFEGDGMHFRLRPIIASVTHTESQRAFQQLGQGHTLTVPPISTRKAEVVRLIEGLMKRHNSTARVRDLGEPWVTRLAAHEFTSLHELRQAEERLRAWLETRNMTHAAKRVGTSRQALTKYLRRVLGDYFDELAASEGRVETRRRS